MFSSENLQDTSPRKEEEGDTTLDAVMTSNQDEQEEDKKSDEMQEEESQQEAETDPDLPSINRELPPVTEETDADDEGDDLSNNVPTQPEVETATISQTAGFQPYTASTLPFITNEEYLEMVSSVIRILAGDSTYQEWITKDFADHQVSFLLFIVFLTFQSSYCYCCSASKRSHYALILATTTSAS